MPMCGVYFSLNAFFLLHAGRGRRRACGAAAPVRAASGRRTPIAWHRRRVHPPPLRGSVVCSWRANHRPGARWRKPQRATTTGSPSTPANVYGRGGRPSRQRAMSSGGDERARRSVPCAGRSCPDTSPSAPRSETTARAQAGGIEHGDPADPSTCRPRTGSSISRMRGPIEGHGQRLHGWPHHARRIAA